LRQLKFTSKDFVPESDSSIPDAVMDEQDLKEIQKLAGISPVQTVFEQKEENISHTAMKRVEYMKKHNIQPGTDDWFKLWFSRPYLTGTTGMKK